MTRLPVEPLLAMFPAVMMHTRCRAGCQEEGSSWVGGHVILAEAAGVSRRTVFRWQKQGLAPLYADEIAGRLGMGPWEIWPEWFDLDVEESA